MPDVPAGDVTGPRCDRPLRILYSHRIQSRDGQSVHLEELVSALRREGHEVLVVGPGAYAAAEFGGENKLVARIRARLPSVVGEVAELGYAAAAAWRLWRSARQFRPDLIYERYNLFHLAGALVSRGSGVPLFLEVNAPLAAERSRFGALRLRWLAQRLEAMVWRAADMVLPVTGVLAEMVRRTGVPAERIRVVPNGINLEDYVDAPAGRQGNGVVLGFVGFVRDWHGLDTVIDQMARMKHELPLRLVVVGDGPARSALERQALECGLGDRVRFTGVQPRDRIPALVGEFDIALQPKVVPYASPLKAFEYMAAARAIVAPDQPNIREILRHERTALLFDPDRPDAMWQAVLRLARDAALRARLGSAARADVVREDYTWAGNARRVVRWAREHAGRCPRSTACPPAG